MKLSENITTVFVIMCLLININAIQAASQPFFKWHWQWNNYEGFLYAKRVYLSKSCSKCIENYHKNANYNAIYLDAQKRYAELKNLSNEEIKKRLEAGKNIKPTITCEKFSSGQMTAEKNEVERENTNPTYEVAL